MKVRSRLAVTFGLALSILIGAGWLAFRNTAALDDAGSAVRDRLRIREELSDGLRLLRRADEGARAHEDAASAGEAVDALVKWQRDLEGSTESDSVAHQRAQSLRPMVEERAQRLREGAQASAGRPEGDAAQASGGETEEARADPLRSALLHWVDGERARLERQEVTWLSGVRRAYSLLAASLALGAIVLAVGLAWLYREAVSSDRAREALRSSEEQFRLLLESLRDYAIFLLDPDGRVASWNLGAQALTGFRAEDVIGQPLARFYPPDEVATGAPRRDLERALARGSCVTDGPRMRQNGSSFWASTTISTLRDDAGRRRGFSVAMRDVNERKRVEDALTDSEARHRAVSEMTSDYAYAFKVSADGKVVTEWVTGAFTRITGYSAEEIERMGGGIALVHPDDLGIALARIRTLLSRRPDTSEFRILTKSGELRWIRESARPVWDEDRQELRVYGAAQDITERKRAEEEAQRHQSDLAHVLRLGTISEMAAGLAHEINQPLSAIVSYARGCVRRIRSGPAASGELLTAIEEIAEQALRADQIVRQLQSFVRKQEPRRDAVAVNDLVRDAARLVVGEAGERGVAVRLDLGDAIPAIRADGIQIEQVILNLLRNALDALTTIEPERRSLAIVSRVGDDGGVEIAVEDTGEGIPREALEEIFTPFFTTKSSGLGMGLAISRSIVEAHGGRIWATTTPGRGTIFRFSLPPAEAT